MTTSRSAGSTTTTAGDAPSIGRRGSACEPLTVNPPTLTITKTADAASVNAGSAIGFTITLSNAGPGASTGTTLTDPQIGRASCRERISIQVGAATFTKQDGTPQSLDCGRFTLGPGARDV